MKHIKPESQKISAYVLTHNSEKYLSRILSSLTEVADEVLVVDSGSTDTTHQIALEYPGIALLVNPFEDFGQQRRFAEMHCSHPWILFLDDDELPDEQWLLSIKNCPLGQSEKTAFRCKRQWFALGKPVHNIYPVASPDYPIRLYNKNEINFSTALRVHERLRGVSNIGYLEGTIEHRTFESRREWDIKLDRYTELAAKDLLVKKKSLAFYRLLVNPFAAFIKWFLILRGYKDGWLGLQLSVYAVKYTFYKYAKARQISKLGVH